MAPPGEERQRRHSCPTFGDSTCTHDGFDKCDGELWIRGTREVFTSKKKHTCRTESWVIYGSLSDDDIDNESVTSPPRALEKIIVQTKSLPLKTVKQESSDYYRGDETPKFDEEEHEKMLANTLAATARKFSMENKQESSSRDGSSGDKLSEDALNIGRRRHSCPAFGESVCNHDGFTIYGGELWIRGTSNMYTSKKKLSCRAGSRVVYGCLSDDDVDIESSGIYVRSLRAGAIEKVAILQQIPKAEQLIKEVLAEPDAGPSCTEPGGWECNAPQQCADTFRMKITNNKVGLVIGKGGETIKFMQAKSGARIQLIAGDSRSERIVHIDGTSEQIEIAKQLVIEVTCEENKKGVYHAVQQEEQDNEFARSKVEVQAKLYANSLKQESSDGTLAWRCLYAKMQNYQKSLPNFLECSSLEDRVLCEDINFGFEAPKFFSVGPSRTGIDCFQFFELCCATKYFCFGNWIQPSEPLLFTGFHSIYGKICVHLFLRSDSSEVQMYERILNVFTKMKFHPHDTCFLGTCSEDTDFLCIVYKFPQNSLSEAEALRLVSELIRIEGSAEAVSLRLGAQHVAAFANLAKSQSESKVSRYHPHIEEVEESGETGPAAPLSESSWMPQLVPEVDPGKT